MKIGSSNIDMMREVIHVGGEVSMAKVKGGGLEERGAIYTKAEVVEFILDLVGYTIDRPLHTFRLLEPSFGEGGFILVAIKRLMKAWRKHSGDLKSPERNLSTAILAVELNADSFIYTHKKVVDLLIEEGIAHKQAKSLASHWLKQADFLLIDIFVKYDFIVGNPPYVRQELISPELISEYRNRYRTIFDRADLYIPFFERSLNLLSAEGCLGLICTDRWMKNRYGGPLRKLISDYFHLKYYVNMVGVDAFETTVSTYPAITVITKQKGRITRTAEKPTITKRALANLSAQLCAVKLNADSSIVKEIEGVVVGADAWLLDAPEERTLVKKLEMNFP
jgi:type I restriction-modification system DNA methylase subunit